MYPPPVESELPLESSPPKMALSMHSLAFWPQALMQLAVWQELPQMSCLVEQVSKSWALACGKTRAIANRPIKWKRFMLTQFTLSANLSRSFPGLT